MRRLMTSLASLLLSFVAAPPAPAQLPPAKDSLNPAPTGQSSAACSATDASSCAQAAAKIMPQVMGPSPMEENLRRLTDEIGGRVTGSPEMAKAIDWSLAAFRAAGIEVHAEAYTLPATWNEGDTKLTIVEPYGTPSSHVSDGKTALTVETKPLRAVSEGWSPPTPPGGIVARVLDLGYGTADDFRRAGMIKGAILLV